MRAPPLARIIEVIGAALLLALLPTPTRRPRPARLPLVAQPAAHPPIRDCFEQTLRAAAWDRMEAKLAVNRGREAMDAWDPAACGDQADGSGDPEAWRLRQLALDPSGVMHRARELGLRAACLARGPDEAYRAAELLVLIEHECGHHDRELAEARRLVLLRPRSRRAWQVLRRAEACPRGQPHLATTACLDSLPTER